MDPTNKKILKGLIIGYSLYKESQKKDTNISKVCTIAINASIASNFIIDAIDDELSDNGVLPKIINGIESITKSIPEITKVYNSVMNSDDKPIDVNDEQTESVNV